MAQQVQWGSIVLLLENEEFRKAFRDGRQYYFEDINGEQPQRAARMTSEEVLRQIMGCDEHGCFHFDEEVTSLPVTYLGILLGYMHGPGHPETTEERFERERQRARRSTGEPSALALLEAHD